MGVLDQRRQRRFLTPSEFSSALFNFADETFRMVRSGALRLVPVAGGILAEAWRVLQEEHIYEADALQIASCKDSRCEVFLSADGNLLRSAKNEGLDGMDPVKDEKRLTAL